VPTETAPDTVVGIMTAFLDALGRLDAAGSLALLAEDGVFEFPYAIPGMPAVSRGHAQIRSMMKGMAVITDLELYDMAVHATDDPELAIATFRSRGHLRGGRPYANRYVSTARVRDGKIVEYHEHFDPLALIRALPATQRIPLTALLALPAAAARRLLGLAGRRR
jgi:ketosteroid isomerase-like protein